MRAEIFEFIRKNGIKKIRKSGDELLCLCPWHRDKSPSLAINLKTGKYHCFGCNRKGIIKGVLNQGFSDKFFYRESSPKEREELDISKYVPLGKSILGMIYWKNRGFDEEEAKEFNIMYRKDRDSICFPIYDENDILVNYVERNILNIKNKYYFPKGLVKSNYLYNYNKAKNFDKIWLVEGTFDSVAVGASSCALLGKSLSKNQLNLLRKSKIEKIILALDKDAKLEIVRIRDILFSFFEVSIFELPNGFKDLAELRQKSKKQRKGG